MWLSTMGNDSVDALDEYSTRWDENGTLYAYLISDLPELRVVDGVVVGWAALLGNAPG